MLIKGDDHMKNLESVQIIKDKNKPKYAVLEYDLFEEIKEIVEDYLDHLHADSVLKDTSDKDWIDLDKVKNELNIK